MVVTSFFPEFLIRFTIKAVALMCSCITAHSRTAVRDCERIKSVVYMARCSRVMYVMILDVLLTILVAAFRISSLGAVIVRLPILTYTELS